MEVCIGTCSLCGGNVMAHQGAWFGIVPPPPPTCASCGAVRAADYPVIPMVPRPVQGVGVGSTTNPRIFGDDYRTDYRYEAHIPTVFVDPSYKATNASVWQEVAVSAFDR